MSTPKPIVLDSVVSSEFKGVVYKNILVCVEYDMELMIRMKLEQAIVKKLEQEGVRAFASSEITSTIGDKKITEMLHYMQSNKINSILYLSARTFNTNRYVPKSSYTQGNVSNKNVAIATQEYGGYNMPTMHVVYNVYLFDVIITKTVWTSHFTMTSRDTSHPIEDLMKFYPSEIVEKLKDDKNIYFEI